MSLRTFLVEDSRTIRDNLVPAIEEMAGARVVQVVDGEQDATSWQNTNDDWSTAVVDLLIKDGSGFGVLNALSKRPAGQRAVVLSNYVTPSMRAKCLAAGAGRVFDKSTEINVFWTTSPSRMRRPPYCSIVRAARLERLAAHASGHMAMLEELEESARLWLLNAVRQRLNARQIGWLCDTFDAN